MTTLLTWMEDGVGVTSVQLSQQTSKPSVLLTRGSYGKQMFNFCLRSYFAL